MGLGMLAWGAHTAWRGMHELGVIPNPLLARTEPAAAPLRPWEACSPEEIAYAQAQAAWSPTPGIDLASAWTGAQRVTAARAVYPTGLALGTPLPRDCSPASGAAFRRFANVAGVEALAADESANAYQRVLAASAFVEASMPPVALYCAGDRIDDYQWECVRLTSASLRMTSMILPTIVRAEQTDSSLRERESWVHGQATIRGSVAITGNDALRLLEMPGGVRPSVRLYLANMLAEDFPAARAQAADTTPFPPLRQRLVALAARETQPDVSAALAVALSRWP